MRIILSTALVATALLGCGRPAHQPLDGAALEANDGREWLTYGRTYDEQRFSPLTDINAASIGRLGLAWSAEFKADRGQEATPLVHDGVLYTTTAWSQVYALDARTGAQLWHYDPKPPGSTGLRACCDVVNRGVALWNDRLFFGALDGRLIALNTKTGAPIWSVQTTDPARSYTITGAPRVVKGNVIIGNAGAEFGVRGYVSAYSADAGRLVWRFYTTPNPDGQPDGAASDDVLAEKAAQTWFDGVWRQTGGGGTVWDAIVYDSKSELLFVGVGNGTPWNHKFRSGGRGDNLFLASIVALRPETGEYVWHYQTTPGESWDYTATQPIMIADIMLDGQRRRVVMQAPKNGFFYVLDAATGHLISADKFAPVDWATHVDLTTGRPVESGSARYENGAVVWHSPAPGGAHNWQPMAFNPNEELVYIPVSVAPGRYSDAEGYRVLSAAWNTGIVRIVPLPTASGAPSVPEPPSERLNQLVAWAPTAKAPRWTVDLGARRGGGVLATAAGLVFQAANDQLIAYDAATGKQVWSHGTGGLVRAAPITYAIGDEQYIAVMVGYVAEGSIQARYPGRLLAFKLGGIQKVPPYPPRPAPAPLDLNVIEPSAGDAQAGALVYRDYCAVCHEGARGSLPNLTRSPMIAARASFEAVVFAGALALTGMASFRDHLSDAQADNLRAYLLWRARSEATPAAAATEDR